MIDVVGYVVGRLAYSWCGYCRRWSTYGTPEATPFVRPSQCAAYRVGTVRNPCPQAPTRDGPKLVVVWPVTAPRGFALTAGDGVPGRRLPDMSENVTHPPPEVAARLAYEVELPKAAKAARDKANRAGWAVEAWYARGTMYGTRTPRIADLVSILCRRQHEAVVMSWIDGKADTARVLSRGNVSFADAKRVLDERTS